jgi:uncharacterized damage-inducible protein DinB
MPGLARPTNDERALLLGFLAQQRDGLRNAAFGLSEPEARSRPAASLLSVAALLKHTVAIERSWISLVQGGPSGTDQGFELAGTDTVETLLSDLAEAAHDTECAIAGVGLDDQVPVPRGVAWFPDDVESWSVRWVLLHLIEEEARHAGHADIIRETIDGATCHALMAAVEGWPATEWLQPWHREPVDLPGRIELHEAVAE